MKSNCGCLLIDDFGRQRVAPAELLNRWIIPLESRQDYLNLPTGKKFCVPFEQTILFSTNLQPEQLVDEAFLRRVPFKINIGDPSTEEFIDLFKRACEASDVPWRPDVIEKLVVKHYLSVGRPLRRCHPRDLLRQVKCLCAYRSERVELRPEFLDLACSNYFGNQPIMLSSAAMMSKPVGWEIPNLQGTKLPSPVHDVVLNGPVQESTALQNSQPLRSQTLQTEVLRQQPSIGLVSPPRQTGRPPNLNAIPIARPLLSPALPQSPGPLSPTNERA